MRNSIKLFIFLFGAFLSLNSCTDSNSTEPEADLPDIAVTATQTSTSIELSWSPVEGCSWYHIYIAKQGETLDEIATYQNLYDDPITYEITDLSADTSYDLKLEGTDYASGGKLIASTTLSVTTNP